MHRYEHQCAPELETLENRRLLAADFRSIDGTGNNLAHPSWGSAGVQLLRQGPAAYGDQVSSPAGSTRPSAREISNAIAAALPEGQPNDRNLSAYIYAWGQFLDHDLDLTPNASPAQPFNVNVPFGDDQFDPFEKGGQVISLNRSQYDPATGTTNARQQVNVLTAWIDGSQIYGSDSARAAALRSFVGGKLRTSADDMLPFNTDLLPNANDAHIFPENQLFLAGDVRANENIELTSMHTLFMREHNRIADELAKSNPKLNDEQLYQRARAIVIAEVQAITYNEFLPALLGKGALDAYHGYNRRVNPGISNEFSTAAFRLGHSMLDDDVEFMDNDGEDVHDEVALSQAFFNPSLVQETGVDPILKYLASTRAQELDNRIVESVRNFLFGPPGAGGLDLASLNIQRGREHGLADYNSTRAAYGLKKVKTFEQITSDPVLAGKLKELYGSVDNVDLWVGGLAEDHVKGSSMGPTFRAILADQFERLRDGDRFWYENQFSGRQLKQLQNTSLADIIARNSGIHNLQDNVFVFDVEVSGMVFNDRDGDGRQDRNERALGGWTVELLDEEGSVIDTTTTDRRGRYTFTELDVGEHMIRVETPGGTWAQTTDEPEFQITRGMSIDNLNIGYAQADAGGSIADADWGQFTDDAASPGEEELLTTV